MTIRRPSLGTVLGATALLVAIAGTGAPAEAAKLINGKLIKAGTITSKQIKDGTITTTDLAPGTLKAGGVGPAGPKGATGPAGPAGANGISGYEMVSINSAVIAAGQSVSATGSCPSGKKVFGATAYWLNVDEPIEVFPTGGSSSTTYTSTGVNPGSGSDSIHLRLVCAFA